MIEFADLARRSGLSHQQLAEELGVCDRTVKRYETGETSPKPRDLHVLRGLIAASAQHAPADNANFLFVDLFASIGRRFVSGLRSRWRRGSRWSD